MEQKLYKPVIVKKVVDDEHYYYVDGEYRPGVTTILMETLPTPYALKRWIGEVGNEKADAKLEQSGARGTLIHNACESLLRGEELKLHETFPEKRDQKCIASFIEWANKYKPTFREFDIEFTVASTLGFAGTLDLFCEINGEPYIVDFKTSASVYDHHILQITAYQYAFFEMTGIMAKRAILHLNPKTKQGWSFVEKMEVGGAEVTVEDFMKVFEVYKMLNGGKVPEPELTVVYPEIVSLYKKGGEDQWNGKK